MKIQYNTKDKGITTSFIVYTISDLIGNHLPMVSFVQQTERQNNSKKSLQNRIGMIKNNKNERTFVRTRKSKRVLEWAVWHTKQVNHIIMYH